MPRDVLVFLPPSPEPPRTEAPALVAMAARELAVPAERLGAVRLQRLSFDARPRHRCWRLALTVWFCDEAPPPPIRTVPPVLPRATPSAPHVVVVGSGPAGLFCALDCAAAGLRVTIVERGRDVRTRRRAIAAIHRGQAIDPDSNYCFGEGGAGTYSDGKLYTRAGRREEVRGVLEMLVAHGAPEDVLASWRPHVGSNRLPRVVTAIRETLCAAGVTVRFATRAEALVRDGNGIAGVAVRRLDDAQIERIACDALVLATGHSARDSLAMAARAGARLEPKGFALGLRIEHPQAWLDAQQYGGLRDACALPRAFYELATEVEGRGVYSFCMCPGGFIVPASTASDRVVVNGMSLRRRDSPFANAGIVVQLDPDDWCGVRGSAWGWERLVGPLPQRPGDDPLFGVRVQEALETLAARRGGGGNRAPAQRADAFVEGRGRTPPPLRASYRPGVVACDLAEVLVPGLTERLRRGVLAFAERLPGFAGSEGQLVAVETRTSSPVRIARDPETRASREVPGLYPCGEGAGYAGGIVSAALDGRRTAAALVARLAA